jgi:hypothetical protein
VLFDNVVDPEASEDVVGLSKRLAEVLADDLAGPAPGPRAEPEPAPDLAPATAGALAGEVPEDWMPLVDAEPGPERQAEPERQTAPDRSGLPADEVRRCVVALQEAFGPRIERILVSRGGLLVVMDRTDEEADRTAQGLSDQVPVALIDRRTLAGLQRLGAASPAAEGEILFDATAQSGRPEAHPLVRQAQAKLDGARVLLDQTRAGAPLGGPAMELLQSSLLCASALLAGRAQPPGPRDAGIWLFGEAIPTGAIDQSDAALVMRAIALAQDADAVPLALLEALAADTEVFVARVAARA